MTLKDAKKPIIKAKSKAKTGDGVASMPERSEILGGLASYELNLKAERERAENILKVAKLCIQLDIKYGPSMVFELALALARKLYPETKKPGRKSKWTEDIKDILVVEVERLSQGRENGVHWACTQIAKKEPWLSFLKPDKATASLIDPAEALRKAYYKNHKKPNPYRVIFEQYPPECWGKLVLSTVKKPCTK